MKCETHTRVLSQTLVHRNSKNEIRQSHRGRRQQEWIWNERQWEWKKRGHRPNCAWHTVQLGLLFPEVMDEIPNELNQHQ